MTRLLIVLLALAPLAACSSPDDDSNHLGTEAEEAEGFGGPIRGDLLETATSDGDEIEVGVTSEVLFLRLTSEARKEVAQDLDEEVPDEGLGGSIGRAVTGFVNDALASAIQIPLEDVEALHYEDGRLRFESDGTTVQIKEDQADGIPMAQADAERIIAAFERAR